MLQFFESIVPPSPIQSLTPDNAGGGLVNVINIGLKFVFIAAGLYAFWNFITAGYMLIGSGGDAKKLSQVRDKYLWTLLGLVVMASAIVVAGLIGIFVFEDWKAVIEPSFITE